MMTTYKTHPFTTYQWSERTHAGCAIVGVRGPSDGPVVVGWGTVTVLMARRLARYDGGARENREPVWSLRQAQDETLLVTALDAQGEALFDIGLRSTSTSGLALVEIVG